MFLSALQPYVVGIIIAIVAVQYAIATFCLLKLAYLDISKREYVLWNLFILLVFFVGDAVFLAYYFRVKDTKKIPPYTPEVSGDAASDTTENKADGDAPTDGSDTQDDVSAETPDDDKVKDTSADHAENSD